ncbi:MAG: glycerate kinase [Betaproteobacteria bacterium]|nr:glycerate kinase [Betaproteobacteria bacterium]
MDTESALALLRQSYAAAVAAADPLNIVPAHLPKPPKGRTLVVGAGKAGASMARAVEQRWPAQAPLEGLMITRYAHGYSGDQALKRITVVEAGHPVPDESGETAAREIMRRVQALGSDDLLLALVSGGGSALLSLPVEGISMADLKATTRELLRCGAPIQDMNTVRKHLSLIQGGKLAAMCKAPILSLVISDVTGDEPTHIGSGPTVPDPTTYRDALDILLNYGCEMPPSVRAHLEAGVRGAIAETPKPGSPVFARAETRVIATAYKSLEAAAEVFRAAGITPLILGDTITGEAREVGKSQVEAVREIVRRGQPVPPRIALISGGECTVTVRNPQGRGGRCSEYLLAAALELAGADGAYGLAADTDGIDGSEQNAGAIFAPDSLARGAALGLDAGRMLEANDAWGFFDAIGGLVTTGPTRTNVNDYRALLLAEG